MKKLLLLVTLLAACYLYSAFSADVELPRGRGSVSATNSPGNGVPALFLTGVTNLDGTITSFYAAPSATATNAQAPSAVLSNLVVTVANNVTNANVNQFNINNGTLVFKSGALVTNLGVYGFTNNLTTRLFSSVIQDFASDGTVMHYIHNTTDVSVPTTALRIFFDTAEGADGIYATFGQDAGAPSDDFLFSQTVFTIGANILSTFNGNVLFNNPVHVVGESLSVNAPTTFSNTMAYRPFTVPNNIGTVYGTNGNLQVRTLTNSSTLSFLEMADGQTIELLVTNRFETNILSFSGLANTNFIDGFFGSIPSNRLVKFFIQKVGTHTNVSYQGPVVQLLAGSNITLATNTDTSITISAAGGAGSIDGTFNTLWVTNWTRHSGGVSNMSWTVTTGINSNLSHVFIAGGLTNTSGTVSLGSGNFLITAQPEIQSLITHRFAQDVFITNNLVVSNQFVKRNIDYFSTALVAVSQQTNVIIDFDVGVWEAGNWATNLNFLHGTNGALVLSESPTNHYSSVKIQPTVNVKVRFPATFNLLNFTNNCTISNGSKAHIVFSSNGGSQTNIDVAITGTQFP